MTQSGVERGRGSAFGLARRVGLRVLAVAGLAGAAWLLSGTAANAAESAPEATASVVQDTERTSVVGIVADLGEGLLGLEGKPDATALGVTSDLLNQDVTGDLLSIMDSGSEGLAARPAAGVAAHAAHAAHAATSQVAVAVLRSDDPAASPSTGVTPHVGVPTMALLISDLLAPFGATGGMAGAVDLLRPVVQLTEPVLAPLSRTVTTVVDVLRFAVAPVTAVLDAATRRAAGSVSGDATGTSLVDEAALASRLRLSDKTRVDTRPGAVADQAAAMPPADLPGTPDVPGAPWPGDPLSGLLGLGNSGNPVSGSGSPHNGGSYAVVPLTVATGEVAFHPRSLATVVGMARQLAENPTVSPD